MDVYLLACASKEDGGGIYQYEVNSEGKLIFLSRDACEKPMYSVQSGAFLHTVLRYEAGLETGCDIVQPILSDGALGLPEKARSSLGEVPCHLTVWEGNTYLVNYVTGNVVKNGELVRQHEGNGPHATRQEKAHTHFVSPLPDGLLGVCDLGTDTLHIYDANLAPVSMARVPAGYGIRHFVTKAVGEGHQIYAINELVPSVSRFSYDKGVATYLDTVEIPYSVQDSTAAAIRLSADGRYLYTSVRGENTLSVFAVAEDGALTLLQTVACGNGPRDFDIDDLHLVCANQFGSTVEVYCLQDGLIAARTDEISLPAPLCVVIPKA